LCGSNTKRATGAAAAATSEAATATQQHHSATCSWGNISRHKSIKAAQIPSKLKAVKLN